MTTEEQLKTYAAYLPYSATAETVLGTKFIMKGISYKGVLQDEKGFDMGAMGTTQLHLWDLSYLTKEIEHEGRVFIPIHVFEITDDSDSYSIEYDHGNIKLIRDLKSIAENNLYFDIQFLPFEVVQRLISWHFNVFGIPAGEFMPKTLKTESND